MILRRKTQAANDIARRRREKRPPSKLRNFAGFIRFLILLGLVMLLVGFAVFARRVENAAPQANLPKADGIAVLTGGTGRMMQSGQLLKDSYAERLLATGVSGEVSDTDLIDVLGVSERLLNCCVDVDIKAQDTQGNARETAIWASALGYEHIILVTSDYHMARAKLEITTATGGIRITPYPVDSYAGSSPYIDTARMGLLWREYLKLLAVYLRETGSRKSAAPQPVPAPVDVMRERQSPPMITGPQSPVNQAPVNNDAETGEPQTDDSETESETP